MKKGTVLDKPCFHEAFIEAVYSIVNREGERVRYDLYRHQKRTLREIVNAPSDSGHLILKAASVGMSSLCLAYAVTECLTRNNRKAIIIAHEDDLTKFLLNRGYEYIELADKSKVYGVTIQKTQDQIRFSNGSLIYLATAGSNVDIGRGQPPNIVILSEIAFYGDAGRLTSALLPRAIKAKKIFESTANGASGWFYHQYKKISEGNSRYFFHFIPWYIHDEYFDPSVEILPDKTQEEIDMQDEFGIKDSRLSWRRRRIEEMDNDSKLGMSGEDAFRQEYPLTADEAFLRSGNPVFGRSVYSIVENSVMQPVFCGDVSV